MRALLPFSNTQSRSPIHIYEGPASVIDARTICVRPKITDTHLTHVDFEPVILHGNISVPIDLLSTLWNETPFKSFGPMEFACEPSNNFGDSYFRYPLGNRTSAWDLSICDLGQSNVFLTSSFKRTEPALSTPSLLMDYTADSRAKRPTNWTGPSTKFANFDETTPGLRYHDRNKWLDFKEDPQTSNWSYVSYFGDTKLGYSLCFPEFQAYVLNISVSSRAPLEEPMYFYDTERSQFRYDHIRKQLVPSSKLSLEE